MCLTSSYYYPIIASLQFPVSPYVGPVSARGPDHVNTDSDTDTDSVTRRRQQHLEHRVYTQGKSLICEENHCKHTRHLFNLQTDYIHIPSTRLDYM